MLNQDRKIITVKEVMKTSFDLVDCMDTVEKAITEMEHVETKALIVDKHHDHDEYGLLLLSDIARYVLAKDRPPSRVNVYEVMIKPMITVHQDMDIRYCARLFERFGLSRAPVLREEKIVGIVSFTDMTLKGLLHL
jgi:predicted transcriptional regulator